MKMRVADYIADLLVQHRIKQIFSVVGGGAMHLNDAFGNNQDLNCIYNHHEQACAMAAESYARLHNEMACVCVTTGPGGTNAITGVLCAWQDSIPMLIISGQVRYNTTVESTGLELRQFGEQEHYIIKTIESITKYSVMLKDISQIRFEIEKAIYLAKNGRRGPCWVDVPLNIQGAIIETDEQKAYIPLKTNKSFCKKSTVLDTLNMAKRPVIIIGNGIRTSEVYDDFIKFKSKLGIPVLAANGNPDLLPCSDDDYFGNFGVIGGRAGNFIVQNADCLLVLGCRLSFKQIGFNYETFSLGSKKIVIDIDYNELKKNTVRIDIPVCIDLRQFFSEMENIDIKFTNIDNEWITYCKEVRSQFPIYLSKHSVSKSVNPYYFSEILKKSLPEKGLIVVGNSCACDVIRQNGISRLNQRLWGNTNCGTMGYDLPAAIGAAVAAKHTIVCVTGDGSIQMNLQELQTIIQNNLPVKIFIHNNNSYYAITQTQNNFFNRLSGCTNESGISFPNFEKIANAYGFPYFKCSNHEDVRDIVPDFIKSDGYGICEIISDNTQQIEPKMKSKILETGEMVSPSIDDLFPFLEKDKYERYSSYDKWESISF